MLNEVNGSREWVKGKNVGTPVLQMCQDRVDVAN